MKYRIYDMYDYFGVRLTKQNRIGEYNTLEECRKAAAEYYWDCGGECDIWVCQRNPETDTFVALDAEPLEYDVEASDDE